MKEKQYEALKSFVATNQTLVKEFLELILEENSISDIIDKEEEIKAKKEAAEANGQTTSTTSDEYFQSLQAWTDIDIDTAKIDETLEEYNARFKQIKNNLGYLNNYKVGSIQNTVISQLSDEDADYSQYSDEERAAMVRSIPVVTRVDNKELSNGESKTDYVAKRLIVELPPENVPKAATAVVAPDDKGYITIENVASFAVNRPAENNEFIQGEEASYPFAEMCVKDVKINLSTWKNDIDAVTKSYFSFKLNSFVLTDIEDAIKKAKYTEESKDYFPGWAIETVDGKQTISPYLQENVKWYHTKFANNVLSSLKIDTTIKQLNAYTGAPYTVTFYFYEADVNYIVEDGATYARSFLYNTEKLAEDAPITFYDYDKIKPNRNYVVKIAFTPTQKTIYNFSTNKGREVYEQSANSFWCIFKLRTVTGENPLSGEFTAWGSAPDGSNYTSLSELYGSRSPLNWYSGVLFNQENTVHPTLSKDGVTLYFESPIKQNRDWSVSSPTKLSSIQRGRDSEDGTSYNKGVTVTSGIGDDKKILVIKVYQGTEGYIHYYEQDTKTGKTTRLHENQAFAFNVDGKGIIDDATKTTIQNLGFAVTQIKDSSEKVIDLKIAASTSGTSQKIQANTFYNFSSGITSTVFSKKNLADKKKITFSNLSIPTGYSLLVTILNTNTLPTDSYIYGQRKWYRDGTTWGSVGNPTFGIKNALTNYSSNSYWAMFSGTQAAADTSFDITNAFRQVKFKTNGNLDSSVSATNIGAIAEGNAECILNISLVYTEGFYPNVYAKTVACSFNTVKLQ